MLRLIFVLAAALLFVCRMVASDATLADTAFKAPVLLASFNDSRLPESSGLTCGRVNKDVLWTINDSGNLPVVHAIDKLGEHRGSFYLPKVGNVDWEAISACTLGEVGYLVIADIGDNFAIRPSVRLYFVPEPKIVGEKLEGGFLTPIATSHVIEYCYPDGARDCEAIAIDEEAQLIYMVSKRDVPVRLYCLPLPQIANSATDPETPVGEHGMQTARFIQEITLIPQPTDDDLRNDTVHGKNKSHITDMAFDAQHGLAVLNTYKHMYVFKRELGKTWAEAFLSKPTFIMRPKLKQAEGLCFDRDGCLYFNSEQNPWPLYQMKRHTSVDD